LLTNRDILSSINRQLFALFSIAPRIFSLDEVFTRQLAAREQKESFVCIICDFLSSSIADPKLSTVLESSAARGLTVVLQLEVSCMLGEST
jgi:hypothetical protein